MAVSVCGIRENAVSPIIYIYTSGTYYRCITGYNDMGIPNDLPGFDYLCVTGTSSTYTDFGGGVGPSSGYDISNCQVDYTSSKCAANKRYVNNTVGCSACSTGAYGSASGYHTGTRYNLYHHPTSQLCKHRYHFDAALFRQLCQMDIVNNYYLKHIYNFRRNTHTSHSCGGTAAYPGDIDACYLVAGQSCSDESGAYTIEKGE